MTREFNPNAPQPDLEREPMADDVFRASLHAGCPHVGLYCDRKMVTVGELTAYQPHD